MKVSKRCQYALKAVLELAARNTGRPVKIHDIADAQGISARFLEVILNELKHGGFVQSRRGSEGGYMLAGNVADITIAQIVRYIQGPISIAPDGAGDVRFFGDEALRQLWQEVDREIIGVCEARTIADLVDVESAKRRAGVIDYSI